MPEVKENVLFSGKKNEILKLSNINGNFATNGVKFSVL
jgi:Fe(3+) dicitrate transport protein